MNIALAIIVENGKVLVGKIKTEKIEEYGGLKYAFLSEHIRNTDTMTLTYIRHGYILLS